MRIGSVPSSSTWASGSPMSVPSAHHSRSHQLLGLVAAEALEERHVGPALKTSPAPRSTSAPRESSRTLAADNTQRHRDRSIQKPTPHALGSIITRA
jgi:hypothetical protein